MNDNLHQKALIAGLTAVENSLFESKVKTGANFITFVSRLEDALCNLLTMADVTREQGVKRGDLKIQGEADGIDRAVAILNKTIAELSAQHLNLGGAR